MLVLSRRRNESIVIRDDITIVVVEVREDKVRLGIEAPAHVPIHRNEVYEAITRSRNPWDQPESAELPSPQRSAEPFATVEVAVHDGLCCPQCDSDQVEIVRVKQAYQGKELVRWRKCFVCAHEFHTLEKVADL